VETYRTEEEQVEALRRWWDENGRSTLAAVALALVAGFGWQGWQQHREEQLESASVVYETLLEATRVAAESGDYSTSRHLAESIKADYSGSAYAGFAALHLARMAVMEDNLATAEEELRWLLTTGPDEEIALLAELRLARVVAARGDLQGGLAILKAVSPGAYGSAYAEAQGDIYQLLGDTEQARESYQSAVTLAAASGVGASESLQLKLQSLNPVTPRASSMANNQEVAPESITNEAGFPDAVDAGE
jgi:predicted negative regulator of RcsB-dependent stress response